jgi:hypothetical protein
MSSTGGRGWWRGRHARADVILIGCAGGFVADVTKEHAEATKEPGRPRFDQDGSVPSRSRVLWPSAKQAPNKRQTSDRHQRSKLRRHVEARPQEVAREGDSLYQIDYDVQSAAKTRIFLISAVISASSRSQKDVLLDLPGERS